MAKSTNDLADALSPLLEARGLDLVDVELHGSELTVFVDCDDTAIADADACCMEHDLATRNRVDRYEFHASGVGY